MRADSPADRLHLRKGDRVLRTNGRAIATVRDIDEYLLRFREGDTVSIDVLRDGIAESERVTLPPNPVERFEHATVVHEMAISKAVHPMLRATRLFAAYGELFRIGPLEIGLLPCASDNDVTLAPFSMSSISPVPSPAVTAAFVERR